MTDRDHRFAEFERLIEEAEAVPRVVDNRVFLLGLDWLYRSAMQEHERTELRECARPREGSSTHSTCSSGTSCHRPTPRRPSGTGTPASATTSSDAASGSAMNPGSHPCSTITGPSDRLPVASSRSKTSGLRRYGQRRDIGRPIASSRSVRVRESPPSLPSTIDGT